MKPNLLQRALAAHLVFACGAAGAAPFVAPGTPGTLNVDYVYESAGTSGDRNDQREWRIKQTLHMRTDLVAQPASPLPQIQPPSADEVAGMKRQNEQVQRAAAEAAPMMAEVQKIVARCGNDRACVERATSQLGFGMAGSAELDKAEAAGRAGVEAARPGAPRYQAWLATAENGTYSVDDTLRFAYSEPQCAKFAQSRCVRNEVRKGGGPLPVLPGGGAKKLAGVGAVEIDTRRNTLALRLPNALGGLPYTATVTSNDPDARNDPDFPKGPQAQRAMFRVSADGQDAAVVVPLARSGEYVVTMPGKGEEGGKLTVRWRFVPG